MWRFLIGACSIESWFGRDFAGGIGSMRQGMRCWKGCGLIHSRCRRGSGGDGAGERRLAGLPLPHPHLTQGPHNTAVVVQRPHEGIDQADPKKQYNVPVSSYFQAGHGDTTTADMFCPLVFPLFLFRRLLRPSRFRPRRCALEVLSKKGLVETPGANACAQNLRYAFNREMNAAITHYDRDYLDKAFYHLERAHVLGQSFTFTGGC